DAQRPGPVPLGYGCHRSRARARRDCSEPAPAHGRRTSAVPRLHARLRRRCASDPGLAMAVLTQARPSGLSTVEAAARLAADGPNTVAKPRPRRLVSRIAGQLTDPLVALLLAAAVVTVALGDWTDMAVILLVITLNTAIGVAQEVRADRAIAALDD